MIYRELSIGKKMLVLVLNKMYDEKIKNFTRESIRKDFKKELMKYCNEEEKKTIESSLSDFMSNYRYGRSDRLSSEKSVKWRTIFLKYLGFINLENFNSNNYSEFNNIFKKFEEYANSFEIEDKKLFELLKLFDFNVELFLSSYPSNIDKLSKTLNSHIRLTKKDILKKLEGNYKLLYIDTISQKLNISSIRIFKDEESDALEFELTQNNLSELHSVNILLISDFHIYLQFYVVASDKIKNINYLILALPNIKDCFRRLNGIIFFTDNNKLITTNCVLLKIQDISKITDGIYSLDEYPKKVDPKIIYFLKSNIHSNNYQNLTECLTLPTKNEYHGIKASFLSQLVGSYRVYNLDETRKRMRIHYCKIFSIESEIKILFKTTIFYDDNSLIIENNRYASFVIKAKQMLFFNFILNIYNRGIYGRNHFLASLSYYSLSTNTLENDFLVFVKDESLDNIDIKKYQPLEYSYDELASVKEKKIYLFMEKNYGKEIDIAKCEDELHSIMTSDDKDFVEKLDYIGYLSDDNTIIYKAYLTLLRNKTYAKLELYHQNDNILVKKFDGGVEEEKFFTILNLTNNYTKINFTFKKNENLTVFYGYYILYDEINTYGKFLFYRIQNYEEFQTLSTKQIPIEINIFLLNSTFQNNLYTNISSLIPKYKKDLFENLVGSYLLYATDLPYMTISIIYLRNDLTCEIKTTENQYYGFYRIYDNMIKFIIKRKVTNDEIVIYLSLQIENSLEITNNIIYGSYAGNHNHKPLSGLCAIEKITDSDSNITAQKLKLNSEQVISNSKYKTILKNILKESFDFLNFFGKNESFSIFENK